MKALGCDCGRCPKKTVLKEEWVKKLRKYFYEKTSVNTEKLELVEKVKTLDEYIAEDFMALSSHYMVMINEKLGLERIVSWKATADEIDFNYGCNFEFLRNCYPDIYRIATDAEDCFKTIELISNRSYSQIQNGTEQPLRMLMPDPLAYNGKEFPVTIHLLD